LYTEGLRKPYEDPAVKAAASAASSSSEKAPVPAADEIVKFDTKVNALVYCSIRVFQIFNKSLSLCVRSTLRAI
jgi:hypothetical protein